MAKREDDSFTTISLNGPFDDRTDPMILPRGTNSNVVNIRRGPNDALMRRFPMLSGSLVTWATSSIPPSSLVGCTVGPALLTVRPDHSDYAVTPIAVKTVGGTYIDFVTDRANAWFPAQVVRSNVVANLGATSVPVVAVAHTTNFKVVATRRQGHDLIDMTVTDLNGNIIVSGYPVVSTSTLSMTSAYPIFLTRHSNDRVALWYHTFAAGVEPTIRWNLIQITRSGITVGAQQTAWKPVVSGPFCVQSTGSDLEACLVAINDTTATTVTLKQFNVSDATVTNTASWTSAVSGRDAPVALSLMKQSNNTTEYLAVGWISGSGETEGTILQKTAFTVLDARRARNEDTAYADSLVIAWTNLSGTGPAPLWISSDRTPTTGTIPSSIIVADFASNLNSAYLYGSVPMGHPASWTIPDTNTTFPLVPMIRMYNTASEGILEFNYVTDKSIELYTANRWFNDRRIFSPFARIGVNQTADVPRFPLGCVSFSDNEASIVYPTYRGDRARTVGDVARLTDIRVTSHLTSSDNPGLVQYAAPTDHASVIAAALPVTWDGSEVVEAGFLHKPLLSASNTGGSGPSYTGTFSFYAVQCFTDQAGQKHRSAPSNACTLVLSAQSPKLYVSQPDSMRNDTNHVQYDIELYATDGSGSVPYLLDSSLVGISSVTSTKTYNSVRIGTVGNPILYTNGGAFEAECPPALWDIVAVSDRLWAIDAENRERIVYTKTKEYGIAYEWNSALELFLGNDAGKAIAIRNMGGNPVVLAENGIYAIYGEGFDNNGGGATFNNPALVTSVKVHPSSRNSAILTPVGLLFETTRGHAIFNGSSVTPLDAPVPSDSPRLSTMVSERCNEVHHFDAGNTFTWNWRNGHTSRWYPSQLSGSSWITGLALPPTGSAGEPLLLASDRSLWFAPDSASPNSDGWSMTGGWITPAGPSGQTSIKEWWITGRLNETGSVVTVKEYHDWSTDVSQTLVFSASTMSNVISTTPAIVTLRGMPNTKRLTSIRLVLSESCPSGGSGFIPLTLSIDQETLTEHNPRRATTILSSD